MPSGVPLPEKQDLPKELWRVVTTLTDEAQNAALKKTREHGYDLNKGRLSLEETFINLSRARDVLLDAIEKAKIPELPLKLQFTLLQQAQVVSQQLTALTSGTDAVLAMEDSVDDLISSIWQYNLQNFSGEVLGFQRKMNQLKTQEVLIRRVHRQAEEFEPAQQRATEILNALENLNDEANQKYLATLEVSKNVSSAYEQATANEQSTAELAGRTQGYATASQAASEKSEEIVKGLQAQAEECRVHLRDVEEAKSSLVSLEEQYKSALANESEKLSSVLEDFQERYKAVSEAVTSTADERTHELETMISGFKEKTEASIQKKHEQINEESEELKSEIESLAANARERLSAHLSQSSTDVEGALDQFGSKAEKTLASLSDQFEKKGRELAEQSEARIEANDGETRRLANELERLESRIRESIERATGFTLFHSFQKRQLDLAKSKKFWVWALAGAIVASLGAAIFLILELRNVQAYNAAFFLKLSISLPLIYLIAFCSVQYSRERRLEEEYAFKSNISISLEPYQKLVQQLVNHDDPLEVAKYTEFIIGSVNRVFTSPTDKIFDDHGDGKNSAEGLIKVLGDFVETILKSKK